MRDIAVSREGLDQYGFAVTEPASDVYNELRERVEAAVRKVGNRLNQRTRAVVNTRSRVIGLILCNDFGLSSVQPLLLGVEEHCAKAACSLLFARRHFGPNAQGESLRLPSVTEAPSLADCLILAGTLREYLPQCLCPGEVELCAAGESPARAPGEDDERKPGAIRRRRRCYEATPIFTQLGQPASGMRAASHAPGTKIDIAAIKERCRNWNCFHLFIPSRYRTTNSRTGRRRWRTFPISSGLVTEIMAASEDLVLGFGKG